MTSHTAVVGHVEWVDFLLADRLVRSGEIRTLEGGTAGPGGGGAMGALALLALTGACDFFCTVGGDELGERTATSLRASGLRVHAAVRQSTPQPRAFAFLEEASGERTIAVLGEVQGPRGDDPLPWPELAAAAAVFLTAGDTGAIRAARTAGVLVATARTAPALREAGVRADVLVGSAADADESLDGDLADLAEIVVRTLGARGGSWTAADGTTGRWEAAPLPGAPIDAYGCGDAFGAALAHALGAGADPAQACALAARVGAAVRCCRAPGMDRVAALRA